MKEVNNDNTDLVDRCLRYYFLIGCCLLAVVSYSAETSFLNGSDKRVPVCPTNTKSQPGQPKLADDDVAVKD
jgi:hypothetical protein